MNSIFVPLALALFVPQQEQSVSRVSDTLAGLLEAAPAFVSYVQDGQEGPRRDGDRDERRSGSPDGERRNGDRPDERRGDQPPERRHVNRSWIGAQSSDSTSRMRAWMA